MKVENTKIKIKQLPKIQKMKKYSLFFVIAFLISSLSFAQPWMKNIPKEKMETNDVNFYDIQKAFNEYWEGKEIEKGKGWKQFKRWEYFMEQRVYPDGEFPSYKLWEEYQKIRAKQKNKTFAGNWSSLGPFTVPNTFTNPDVLVGAGRLNCISFHPTDPNIMWVGSPSGGVWKTINGGESWETTTDDLVAIGVSDIAVNPDNPDILYVATGDGDASDTYAIGILKSTNGGETWETIFDIEYESGLYFRRILINPYDPDVIIATSNDGIIRTDDGFSSYSTVVSGHFKDLEFKPGDPNTLYSTTYNYYGNAKVYKSVDGGSTWSVSSSGMSTSNVNRIELAVTPADPNIVYALCCSSIDNGFHDLYVSNDNGDTWSDATNTTKNLLGRNYNGQDSGGQGWYDLALAVSPENENEIYVGGINTWKTSNGGDTWEINTFMFDYVNDNHVHVDMHMFAYSPFGVLFSANDGGIYKTSDGGESWIDITSNMQILQIYRFGCDPNNPDLVVTGNQDNSTILRNGSDWGMLFGGDGMECIIDYTDSDIIYGSSQYGNLYKTIDGGYNVTYVTPPDAPSGSWITPYVMHPDNHNTLIAGYDAVYKTTDGGSSWTTISPVLAASSKLRALTYAPSYSNYIYTSSYTNMWKTDDGGHNWVNISSGLANYYITYIEVSSYDQNLLWVTLSNFVNGEKVYKSEDGGETWENYSEGLPDLPMNCIEYENSSNHALYAGCDIGVYYRNGEMSEWISFNDELPNVIVNELEIHYETGKVRAATYGRGLWESDLYLDTTLPAFPMFIVPENLIYSGEFVDFRDYSYGDPTSYLWTFEGGTPETSTAESLSVQYNSSGVFDVTLEVSNEYGSNIVIKEDYITVEPNIICDFDADVTNGDAPMEVTFTDDSEGDILSWLWNFGDEETSTEQNPVHIYNIPGTYDITLTITDIYDEVSEMKSGFITVNSTLVSEFTASPVIGPVPLMVNFADNSTGDITSWSWNFGDDATNTDQNPVHTYESSGVFSVELTVSNGIYDITETKTDFITIWPVGVDEVGNNSLVSIYPNPGDGIVNLLFSQT